MTSFVARDCYTSIIFDGVDDRVSTVGDLPACSSLTYMAWVRSAGYRASGQTFMGSNSASEFPLFLQASNGTVQVFDVKNSVTMINTTIQWRHREWMHLAFTYDGSSGASTLYVNGRAAVTQTGVAGRVFGPNGMRVGAWNGGSWFAGCIDEPRVYDRALSAAEIAQCAFNGNYPSDAVLAWNFDEGVGTSATVASGFPRGVAGTLFGGAAYCPDVPLKPPLIDIGARLAFYGEDVNDAVSAPAAALGPYLQGASCVVMGCWVKALDIGGNFTAFYLPNAGGPTAISLVVNSTHQFAANVRSREGGFVVTPFAAIPQYRYIYRAWRHLAVVANYASDVCDVYVDGVLAGTASGSPWEDDSYQCGVGPNVAFPSTAGTANSFGLVADPAIGVGIPTKEAMRNWATGGQFPVTLLSRWAIGVAPQVSSGLVPISASIVGSPAIPFGVVENGPFW